MATLIHSKEKTLSVRVYSETERYFINFSFIPCKNLVYNFYIFSHPDSYQRETLSVKSLL